VENAKVLFNFSKVKITFHEVDIKAEDLKTIIERLGYPVVP